VANNNQIYKLSNAGGFKSLNRYYDMLAGNTTWNPWEPQGAYDALATVTVPSGGATSVIFSGIPTGYKHLQIRGISRRSAADTSDGQSFMRLNSDSGSNYSYHTIYGNGGGGVNTLSGASNTSIQTYATPGANQSAFNGFVIDLLDYASTNKNKTVRWFLGFDGNGGAADVELTSGAYYSLSAVNTIELFSVSTSWTQYSSFALYGVK
jgi:hypothetical protein